MAETIKKYLAHFFSGVFNPFVMPSMAFLIILSYMPGFEMYSFRVKLLLMSIVLVSTCILPLLFILLISANRYVNRDMMHHRDRILPFIFSAFSFFIGAQVIGKLPIPHIFSLFLLGSCLVLIMLFAITTRWKISGHGVGVGGFTGALLAITFKYGIDLSWPIFLAILISGAVGTSRIYLGKHTPAQVYAGFGLSVFIMYLTIYFF
jgi:hypothetical protein